MGPHWFMKPLALSGESLPKCEQGSVRIVKLKAYFNTAGKIIWILSQEVAVAEKKKAS